MVVVKQLDDPPISETIKTFTKIAFQRKNLIDADFNRSISQYALLQPLSNLAKPIFDSLAGIFQNPKNFRLLDNGVFEFSDVGTVSFINDLQSKDITTGLAIGLALNDTAQNGALISQGYSAYARLLASKYIQLGTTDLKTKDILNVIKEKTPLVAKESSSTSRDDVLKRLELLKEAGGEELSNLRMLETTVSKVAKIVQPEGVTESGREVAEQLIAEIIESSMEGKPVQLEGVSAGDTAKMVGIVREGLESPRAMGAAASIPAGTTEASIFDSRTELTDVSPVSGNFKDVFLGERNNTYNQAVPKDLWAFSPVAGDPKSMWAFGSKVNQHEFQDGILTIPDRDLRIPITRQFIQIMGTKLKDFGDQKVIKLNPETKAIFKEVATKIPKLLESKSQKLAMIKLGLEPFTGTGILVINPTDAKKKFTILMGERNAGNNSKKVLKDIKQLGDFLLLHNKITKRENMRIQLL